MGMVDELKTKANALFSKGNVKEAIEIYEKCLSHPEIDKNLEEIVKRNLAQCFLNLGNYDQAIEVATEALALLPSDTKALYRRCIAYEKSGNLRDAISDVRRLVQLDPKNKAIKDLAFRLESSVMAKKEEAESLTGKINSMFSILTDPTASDERMEKALNNLIALNNEEKAAASAKIWSHPGMSQIFELCNHPKPDLVNLVLTLLGSIIKQNSDYGLRLLNTLSPQYFIRRVFSPCNDASAGMCKFLRCLLESLTQISVYRKAREAAIEADQKDKSKPKSFLPRNIYPPYKLDEKVKKPVEEVLCHIIRATSSYRLEASARDTLLELLAWIVPEATGIAWSRQFVAGEGNIERLLEVAAAASASMITQRPVRGGRTASAEAPEAPGLPEISRGGVLKTSANTRMTVACLLSRIFDDLHSDKDRQKFSQQCADFILDLLTDKFIESKVEAAAVIGTLFSGPYEVGSHVLSREGILEGLLLLTQAENVAYQTVALDTIILATNKKDKCMAIIDQAVPILRSLYKSSDDAIKVRALVGLCKLGVLGGTDASSPSMAEGSTVILTKACRRLLLGQQSGDNKAEAETSVDFARIGPLSAANSTRWAVDGLAFLSLAGEVKEAIVKDRDLLTAIYKVAEMGYFDAAFPLASLLANLTNSFEEKEITPEMVELAKFTKQHIPEKHEADDPKVIAQRRQTMIDAGLPSCLFNLTTKLLTNTVASQPGIRELVSRIYLSCAECVDCRGVLVSAGAGRVLINLALENNTDGGKRAAAQALAKLTITADPRLTFPGQRSLEVIRPILQLLNIDCPALQNFEALLALTNLASLDDNHRSRIIAEGGLPLVEHYMFEEHKQLRRAAVECFANLAQHHATVIACGGTLPLEEHVEVGRKLPSLASGSEVVKLLMLYCLEEADVALVRAAAGALATMSYDPGIIKKIVAVNKWFDILQAVAAHPSSAIQHRAAFLLRNLVVVPGERGLAEYLAQSSMLEVLMALAQQPSLSDTDPFPPETVVLSQGRPKDAIRREAIKDREKTKEAAMDALKKLAEYGLIKEAGAK
uniref:TPR_REGION domain-containing protein n=2 Tax=Mesocestoides corti TaxID=53468 RepID=A0A5K3FTK2_MESCO